MRTSFMRFMLCAVVAVAFTACDKEIYNENGMLPDGTTADGAVPEGYFRATFFPEQGGDASTRAVVEGESKAIQSLICIIYQEQSDGTFRYLQEMPVLTYDGPVASEGQEIQPREYTWPLKNEVTFLLPKEKKYKAVFVGNSDKNLFEGQDGQLLSDYKQRKYDEARLCMPDKGPVVFNDYNMFYLCTVDFSEANFAEGGTPPHVLMQRVVSSNVYGRKTIDLTNDVREVVNMLVDEIMKNDKLLTSSIETLLKSNLLSWINDPRNILLKGTINTLLLAVGGVDTLISQLTTNLVGPVLDVLRTALLDELTKQLQSAVQGDTNESLLGLGYVLAPWEHVDYVEITYASLPQNMDFDRKCTLSSKDAGPYKYKLDKFSRPKPQVPTENEFFRTFTVTTFCGEQKVSKITVNSDGIVGGLFDTIDAQLLDGLLINIQNETSPLTYTAESNREYTTFYDLVRLALNDVKVSTGSNDRPSDDELESAGLKAVSVDIDLVSGKDGKPGVIDLSILRTLLGPLGTLLETVLSQILNPVTDIVEGLVGGDNGIKIYLPALLDINSISLSGEWGDTEISYSTEKIPRANQ